VRRDEKPRPLGLGVAVFFGERDERRTRGAHAQRLRRRRAPYLARLDDAHAREAFRLKLDRPERLPRRRDDDQLQTLARGLRAEVPDGLAYQVETAGCQDEHGHLWLEAQINSLLQDVNFELA